VGDGGASYETCRGSGDGGPKASDQVSALEADDPRMCQGVVKEGLSEKRNGSYVLRSNFAGWSWHMGERSGNDYIGGSGSLFGYFPPPTFACAEIDRPLRNDASARGSGCGRGEATRIGWAVEEEGKLGGATAGWAHGMSQTESVGNGSGSKRDRI
jgi:hypothetical protein